MPEYVTIPEALAELPTESAEAVAEFLRDQGVTGDKHSSSCPIAVWITRRTGQRVTVVVNDVMPTFPALGRFVNPHAVREFIRSFDRGVYPHLIG